MKTFTTYLAIRIAVEADSQREAEDIVESIRDNGIQPSLPTGAKVQGWIDTFHLVPAGSDPAFTA